MTFKVKAVNVVGIRENRKTSAQISKESEEYLEKENDIQNVIRISFSGHPV